MSNINKEYIHDEISLWLISMDRFDTSENKERFLQALAVSIVDSLLSVEEVKPISHESKHNQAINIAIDICRDLTLNEIKDKLGLND